MTFLSVVIFTDLDGTLLDHNSYGWEKAAPALTACQKLHIPIVFVSSKTKAEMDIIRQNIGLFHPFISENGGGIFFSKAGSKQPMVGTILAKNIWRLDLGVSYESLVRHLQSIREELQIPIRGFSDMTPGEISDLTGLDLKTSALAQRRDYDEPFIITNQEKLDLDALKTAVKKRNLKITQGGRFFHLLGKNDKGLAVKKLISWYRESNPRVFTIALGDSPNDFSMLKEVDQPVLVRSPGYFIEIDKEIPGLILTAKDGPEGWNAAVLDILEEKIMGGISENV